MNPAETEGIIKPQSSAELKLPFILLCIAPLIYQRLSLLWAPRYLYDFIQYWVSGKLYLAGANPYDSSAIFAMEKSLGWIYSVPATTFSPPWSLPLHALAAAAPMSRSRAIWFVLSLLINCGAAVALWRYYGGAARRWWIALLVCASFIAMGVVEFLGQVTPLMLLAITAFLWLVRKKRYFWAGVALWGLGAKPHLVYLFFLAVLLWAVQKRIWNLLAGSILSYGLTTAAAVAGNRNALQYLNSSLSGALETSCGVGGALRLIFGFQHHWLQFLPLLPGLIWFAWYWKRNRKSWDWGEHLPLLLIVSIASSPYCWFHDFILILPALIRMAAGRAYRSFYVILQYFVLQELVELSYYYGVRATAWMCVVSLLWLSLYFAGEKWLEEGRSLQQVPITQVVDSTA
jgi:hypothetical protein